MTKNLYIEKPKKRVTQKIDSTGLAEVPNYKKKTINKKATHNSMQLRMMDIAWQKSIR